MEYFGVKNFERFQHYKSGKKSEKPTWIKLYISILHDYDFNSLSTHEQAVLMKLWVLAGTADNHLPLDITYISRAIQIKRVRLENLFRLGFLVNKGLMQKKSSRNLALEENINKEYKQENINKEEKKPNRSLPSANDPSRGRFEEVWALYPEKLGKAKAELHFNAQVKTDQDFENIKSALQNYKLHIGKLRLNGHPDRRYQHGATWFNKYWRDWVNPQVEEPVANGNKPVWILEKERAAAKHEEEMRAIEKRAFDKAREQCQ